MLRPWFRKRRSRSARCPSSVVTTPPSPVVMCLTGCRLKIVRSLRAPTRRPRYSAPSACAPSSITRIPRARARVGRVQIAGLPGEMHGDHGPRPRRESGREQRRIQVEGVGAHVRELGSAAEAQDGVRGRHERERGDHDLIARADPRGEHGRLERGGSGAHRDRVLRADVLGEPALELRPPRAGRDEVRAQRFDDGADIAVVDRLPPVREQRRAHRAAAVDGAPLTHARARSSARPRATTSSHHSSTGTRRPAASRPRGS